jgi:hypothetical protein
MDARTPQAGSPVRAPSRSSAIAAVNTPEARSLQLKTRADPDLKQFVFKR